MRWLGMDARKPTNRSTAEKAFTEAVFIKEP
jgi:hypothetical protein